jgi:hypothetical protein
VIIRIKRQGDLVILVIKDDPTRCGKRDLQVVLTQAQVTDLIKTLQEAV